MTWLDDQLARVLATGYLDDLEHRDIADVRSMRAECQAVETAVSYLRRMAQGRLDIVHAYLDRAPGAETVDLDSIVNNLPAIIASGPPRPPGPGRLASPMVPEVDVDDLTEELDGVLDAAGIAELSGMDRERLQGIADRLGRLEATISDHRRALHERIDRLQAEIVGRYKTGRASVDGLLS